MLQCSEKVVLCQEAAAQQEDDTCVICLEAVGEAGAVLCGARHYIHDACFERLVVSNVDALRSKNALAFEADVASADALPALEGRVRCPVPGCPCREYCPDSLVVSHVPEEVFETYLSGRTLLKAARQFGAAIEGAARQVSQGGMDTDRPAAPTRDVLMGELLKASFSNARQCSRCFFGPVELSGCDDLIAHHGESGGSNACPRCGWLAASWSEWMPWDGRSPDASVSMTLAEAVEVWKTQPQRMPVYRDEYGDDAYTDFGSDEYHSDYDYDELERRECWGPVGVARCRSGDHDAAQRSPERARHCDLGDVEPQHPACCRCGCARRWDEDDERVCWCDACHDGCCYHDDFAGECETADLRFQSRFATEHPDSCIVCGCSAEWDAEGERICWCDVCAAQGCAYLTASRPTRSRWCFASPSTLPRFTSLGMAIEASRREHTVGQQRYLAEAVEEAERQKARERQAKSEEALAAEEEAAWQEEEATRARIAGVDLRAAYPALFGPPYYRGADESAVVWQTDGGYAGGD